MIWKFFLPLISFLGLIGGIILAKVSPEEMKPGKQFFIYIRLAVLVALVITLIYYGQAKIIFFVIGLIAGYFLRLTYLYLGIALAMSLLVSNTATMLVAALIFIYGFPYGTLLEAKKKIKLKKLLWFACMFAIPFPLLLISDYTNIYYVLALSAGLLVGAARERF